MILLRLLVSRFLFPAVSSPQTENTRSTYARDGLKAVLSRQRQRSRQRRGKAAKSLTEARQGRGRELEAEARQTKFEARPRRGEPLKKPSFP